jgi:hypothetical protein
MMWCYQIAILHTKTKAFGTTRGLALEVEQPQGMTIMSMRKNTQACCAFASSPVASLYNEAFCVIMGLMKQEFATNQTVRRG